MYIYIYICFLFVRPLLGGCRPPHFSWGAPTPPRPPWWGPAAYNLKPATTRARSDIRPVKVLILAAAGNLRPQDLKLTPKSDPNTVPRAQINPKKEPQRPN